VCRFWLWVISEVGLDVMGMLGMQAVLEVGIGGLLGMWLEWSFSWTM
jgi:hypothetical protein